MRRKINGEAYLIIKKNYTLIIRNSNSDSKITLLIEPTTITTYKISFFSLRQSKQIIIWIRVPFHKGCYHLKNY